MEYLTIDICIPAYNESTVIGESLNEISRILINSNMKWRIIVSDDGSTDGTLDTITNLHIPRVHIISNSHRGKGAAIVAAAKFSSADMFGFIDADISADPSELKKFIDIIKNGKSDIVIGSRLLDLKIVDRGLLRTSSSRFFNLLRKTILGIRVKDSQCGIKLMNPAGRKILVKCIEQGWFMDLEFLYKAEIAGLRITESPIHWTEQRFKGHPSKLNILVDGWAGLRAMLRIRNSLF